jgi:hypothetical protein
MSIDTSCNLIIELNELNDTSNKYTGIIEIDDDFLDPLTKEEKQFYIYTGNIIFYFLHFLRIIQGLPWYIIGYYIFLQDSCNQQFFEILTQYDKDGSLNTDVYYFMIFWHAGCFINASAISILSFCYNPDTLSIAVGYITWWFSLFLLICILYSMSKKYGIDAENKDAIIDAYLFKILGIRAAIKVNRGISGPIWVVFSFIPALITGFIIDYFNSSSAYIVCDTSWEVGDICNSDVCCKLIEQSTFDFFTFFAFLTANVLGSYKLLEFSAICIFYSNLEWNKSFQYSPKQLNLINKLNTQYISYITAEENHALSRHKQMCIKYRRQFINWHKKSNYN